jgi:hypothetical protein
VEFRLLYTGELPPNGSAAEKQRVRSYFHPQLKKLWSLNPSLLDYAATRGQISPAQAEKPTENVDELAVLGMEYLASNHEEFGFNFLPLVEKEYCVSCSLDILFLRKGGQGNLVTNGDLDARIKTLFDALQKPQQKNECGGAVPTEDENPFFVLLQNDKLVSELKITTDQLLDYSGRFLPNSSAHLVIGVKLTPMHYGNWRGLVFQ